MPIPKRFIKWVMIFAFAELLHGIALYQLEIVYIGLSSGWGHFDFPFYVWTTSFAVARDFWYAIDFISRIFGYVSLYKLVSNYKERLIRTYNNIYNYVNIYRRKVVRSLPFLSRL